MRTPQTIYFENHVVAVDNPFISPICSIDVCCFIFQEDCNNNEHEIIMMERYNADVEEHRIKMFAAGWWWGVFLPYEYHPDGGLKVTYYLVLDWEVTFEQPWEFPTKPYNTSPTHRDVFCPAVPLSAQPIRCKEGRYLIDDDGFEKDWLLIDPWDLDDDE
jgi:hypothetical protein